MIKSICVFLICVLVLAGSAGCNKLKTPVNTPAVTSDAESISGSGQADTEENGDVEENYVFEYASEENVIEDMSESEKSEINSFLSCFSEAQYSTGRFFRTEDMINFAYVYNHVHNEDFTDDFGSAVGSIDEKLTDSTLNKFFGKSVLHETPAESTVWKYEDGKFTGGKSDEATAYFSLATEVYRGKDSSLEVLFDVYFNINDPFGKVDADWYFLTPDEAAQYFEFCYSGRAVIRSSANGYQTVIYETN